MSSVRQFRGHEEDALVRRLKKEQQKAAQVDLFDELEQDETPRLGANTTPTDPPAEALSSKFDLKPAKPQV